MNHENIIPQLWRYAKPSARWLEGFSRPAPGFQHTLVYTPHDRDVSRQAQEVYASVSHEACAWLTAPATSPRAAKTLTFLWEAALGSCNGVKRFNLLVNGKRRFTFKTLPDWHWTMRGAQGSALTFLAVFSDG